MLCLSENSTHGPSDHALLFVLSGLQQATIDFTSASTNAAQARTILVDTNAVVLHEKDVGNSVCVLAVEGFGENNQDSNNQLVNDAQSNPGGDQAEKLPSDLGNYSAEQRNPATSPFAAAAAELRNDAPAVVRGPRPWRETVGGGTICCSQCCSVLGFASLHSPETYRFLKHRLVTCKQLETDFTPLTGCASFVAHEMIRYAETKAIFTFVVERNESYDTTKEDRTHILLLKLLSWDSQLACSEFDDNERLQQVQNVQFRKTAKIIYEESWFDGKQGSDTMVSGDNTDISSWVWGGADLCCLPNSTTGAPTNSSKYDEASVLAATTSKLLEPTSQSSVRLLLEAPEWDELQQSLRDGANFYSEDTVKATVAAKFGRRNIPDRKGELSLGLSIIPLSL